MTWGFKNRLNTILPDGRAVMLAMITATFRANSWA